MRHSLRRILVVFGLGFVLGVVQSAPLQAMEPTLRWLGHSAFVFTTRQGKVILIDPWITNPKAPKNVSFTHIEGILVTHAHADHVGEAFELAQKFNAPLIASYELTLIAQKKGVKNTLPINPSGSQMIGDVTDHSRRSRAFVRLSGWRYDYLRRSPAWIYRCGIWRTGLLSRRRHGCFLRHGHHRGIVPSSGGAPADRRCLYHETGRSRHGRPQPAGQNRHTDAFRNVSGADRHAGPAATRDQAPRPVNQVRELPIGKDVSLRDLAK